jgi:mono/diheme cytochrome c family protein
MAACLVMGVAACSQERATTDNGEPVGIPADAGLIADGRAIAEAQCAGCHAIAKTGESPRTDAPPLRHVLDDYAPEALAQDFREHIHVGHADMPDFDFGTRGTDALLAYLVSIREPAR